MAVPTSVRVVANPKLAAGLLIGRESKTRATASPQTAAFLWATGANRGFAILVATMPEQKRVQRFKRKGATLGLAAMALAVVLSTTPASAQQALPSDATIQLMLQELVNRHGITGIVVGLLDERGTRRVIAYGNPGSGALPIDGESVFEIGSITKVFTGILLADMLRRGEVELADPVADMLPPHVRVPSRHGKVITLLDLTTHFSGLPLMPENLAPSNPANPFAGYTVSKLYEFISRYELQRDPGDTFEYSNVGAGLLGHALSLRAGTTYAVLVSDRILRRLGMTHTAVTFTPWMKDHLVLGHNRAGTPVANWDFPTLPGMGGLRSTMNDMLGFAAANLSSEETDLTLAMRDSHRGLRQIVGDPKYPGIPSAFKQGRVGFNWFISRPGERRITWTVGLTLGYSTFLGLDIQARRAVVVLTNTGLNNVDYVGFHLLDPTVPLTRKRESGVLRQNREPHFQRSVSRQRPRVRVPSSPPFIPKELHDRNLHDGTNRMKSASRLRTHRVVSRVAKLIGPDNDSGQTRSIRKP
jgi:CubicO group peptidase (beta-lactamase class C family)